MNLHPKPSLSPCRLEALYLLTQDPKPKTRKLKLDPKPQNPHNHPTGGRGNPHSIAQEGGILDHRPWRGGGGGGRGARDHIYIYRGLNK